MTMTIKKGKTFRRVYRPMVPPYIFKPIVSVSNTAPALINVPGHELVTGQYVAVVSVKGMTQINAASNPPAGSDYKKVTVVDADNITLDNVNASDFRTYESGGYLQFHTPLNMAGCTARRMVKDRVGGTILLELTTENGRIEIDNAAHTISENIPATTTDDITWVCAVSDLELEMPDGTVIEIVPVEEVEVVDEVTT